MDPKTNITSESTAEAIMTAVTADAATDPVRPSGPLRTPPAYYIGETYRGKAINHPDVERHPNGAIAGKRNKLARRVLRNAMRVKFSSIERKRGLIQGMTAQAYEVAHDDQKPGVKRGRWARRLLAAELAIHQPVYVPTQKELRATRTAARKRVRKGLSKDAMTEIITKIVDAQP